MPKTEHWQWYVERFSETELHHHAVEETYYAGRTPFQDVAVIRTAAFGKMLVLDGDTQSSQADEKIYHESLVHPALAAAGDRSEILILGGGEGATLREVLRRRDVRRCTMVDIDGDVVDLSKRYLPEWSAGAFDDRPGARHRRRRAGVLARGSRLVRRDRLRPDRTARGLAVATRCSATRCSRDIKARLAPGGVYVLQASTAGLPQHAPARQDGAHAAPPLSLTCARSTRTFPPFDNDWAFIACSDAVDVAALPPERIDAYMAGLRGESYFYDAETHRRIFSLPLYLRRELAKDGDVF